MVLNSSNEVTPEDLEDMNLFVTCLIKEFGLCEKTNFSFGKRGVKLSNTFSPCKLKIETRGLNLWRFPRSQTQDDTFFFPMNHLLEFKNLSPVERKEKVPCSILRWLPFPYLGTGWDGGRVGEKVKHRDRRRKSAEKKKRERVREA